jgi:TM2 domain-containing membrane protein YozV
MLKKILLAFTFLFLITFALFAQERMQDVVYLKDGSIIHGTIIEQVPNVSIKIQTRDQNIFVYSIENILKITKEPIKGLYGNEEDVRGYKSPGLAFALSFLFPGIGQYYNGDIAKGVIQSVLYAGGWTLFFTCGWEWESYEYWTGMDYAWSENEIQTPWLWIGLSLASGSAIWSMIDAPISANAINKRNQQSYGHLFEIKQGKNVIGFDFGLEPIRKGLGTRLSYHF